MKLVCKRKKYMRSFVILICFLIGELKGETMIGKKTQALVLAAGKSSRLKTNRTKLLEKICGQEMILYITKLLEKLHIAPTLIVGYKANEIMDVVTRYHGTTVSFVPQTEQKGTGHAVMVAQDVLEKEYVLVLNGDGPLITPEIIENLLQKHHESNAAISLITSCISFPAAYGYGRIVQDEQGVKIVEAADYTGDTTQSCCINAGIYVFNKTFLQENLSKLQPNNKKQEYYLTDLIKIACDQNLKVETVNAPFDSIRGVNDFKELWEAEQITRAELITFWMKQGVRFLAPHNVFIDLNVTIGAGAIIGTGVHLLEGTQIGNDCVLESFSTIKNCKVGNNVTIHSHSVLADSEIKHDAQIGPFAHISTQSSIGTESKIGNFVEVKRSTIDKKTKVKHLSYIGDALIGSQVNIGAGTITCNYDGQKKHTTTIEDNAFIGSNNTLVAPITIEKNAYTAGGSVITKDVPKEALAIARAHQVNKAGYARKLKELKNKTSGNSDDSTLVFKGAQRADSETMI